MEWRVAKAMMRISCRGRTSRERGMVLLDALFAVLILLIGIAAAAGTVRIASQAIHRYGSAIEQTLARRNTIARTTTEFDRSQ
jgi:Tfp pilus assembly protein PilV